MGFAPTGRDIELAMELYASSWARAGEWQAMVWLWNELPWSARLITHFGAAKFEWWKRRYVLPLLCRAALPFLERFAKGEWTRSEAGMVHRWFSFFTQAAASARELFSPKVIAFLSDACPSFGGGRFVAKDEPYAQYRASQGKSSKPSEATRFEEAVRYIEPVSEKTRDAAHGCIGKLNQLRESVGTLSGCVERTLRRAFPMRYEMQRTMADIHSFQDTLFSLLMALDDALLTLSDMTLGTLSDTEAREVVREQEALLGRIRASMSNLESSSEQLLLRVDEQRNALFHRIHVLVRSLDRLSVLDPSNPFHSHQARAVREARDQIKKFRGALAKGPGPEIALDQLEKLVGRQIGLSEGFHAEGAKIAAITEKLGRYESHIQVLLSEESTLIHKRSSELRELLTKIIDLRAAVTVIPDLEEHFHAIARAMEELAGVHKLGGII